MIKNGIRLPQHEQDVYGSLSKEQLMHLIGEYKHVITLISINFTEYKSQNWSLESLEESLKKNLNILNMYSNYNTKKLSDEIDFRMGKFDANEWRIRRGLEADEEFENDYWDLEKY